MDKKMPITVCKNCHHRFEGKYCSNCGQIASTERINLQYLIHAISISVLQLERGFLFTVKELFLHPGHMIRDFLEGKRQPYVRPLSFLIFTSALYVLVSHFLELNTHSKDIVEGFKLGMEDNNQSEADTKLLTLLTWITSSNALSVLLTLPLFSLGSFLAFKSVKYNYFEHLVLNTYIAAQQMIIYLVASFFVSKDDITEALPLILGFVFNIYVFCLFFNSVGVFKRIIRFLLVYVTYFMQVLLLLFILIGVMTHLK